MLHNSSDHEYKRLLDQVEGLSDLVDNYQPNAKGAEHYLLMELVLHGLFRILAPLCRQVLESGYQFNDLFSSMLNMQDTSDDDDDDEV